MNRAVSSRATMLPAVLLAAAVPVFFLALGANSIWDANEAFYVETPRQMVETGDYVTPMFGGEPRLNKPVLSYWLVAAFYHAFGVSVAIERLVIALGAMGLLVAVYLIGRGVGTEATGLIAALLVATSPRIVFFSRRIVIDVYITLFMALSLAAFVLAMRDVRRRRLWLALMYVAMALGVLTKGPMAVALPAAACLGWLAAEGRLGEWRRLWIGPGTLIILTLVSPWYLGLYAEHGWAPIRAFFLDENLGRLVTPITTARGAWFFLPVLLADILMPWAPLVAVPLITGWRRAAQDEAGPLRRLLLWWVAVIVAAFSISASKEDLYIFPAIPAAAVLVADALIRSGFGWSHRGLRGVLWGLAAFCLVLALAVAQWLTSGFYAMAGAWTLAAIAAGAGLGMLAALWRGRGDAAVWVLAAAFVAFNYVFVLRLLPDVERLKPVPPLAAIVNARAAPEASIAFFNMDLPSFVYYTRRPVTKVGDAEAAVHLFEQRGDVWMLAGALEGEALRARLPAVCVAARQPLFVAKASDILAGRPPPDVLLLTNNCQ